MKINSAKPAQVILILAFVFLGAQAFTGEQGLLRWRQYSLRADQLESEKAKLNTRTNALNAEVARLKGAHADKDTIEEIAINRLIMASPDDVVVKIPQTASSSK